MIPSSSFFLKPKSMIQGYIRYRYYYTPLLDLSYLSILSFFFTTLSLSPSFFSLMFIQLNHSFIFISGASYLSACPYRCIANIYIRRLIYIYIYKLFSNHCTSSRLYLIITTIIYVE